MCGVIHVKNSSNSFNVTIDFDATYRVIWNVEYVSHHRLKEEKC